MMAVTRQTGLPNSFGPGVTMNDDRSAAGLAPAVVRAEGAPGAVTTRDEAAFRLPEDPFTRRAGGSRARLAGTPALVLLASLIVSLLAASSAPTPLYGVYQQRWGFSPVTTTVVFGVYALAVLASLLTLGRLSDY